MKKIFDTFSRRKTITTKYKATNNSILLNSRYHFVATMIVDDDTANEIPTFDISLQFSGICFRQVNPEAQL